MLKVILTAILLALGTMLIGCQTMGETSEQKMRRYNRMARLNNMMLYEDLEALFLLDQPSQLTHWQLPIESIK